MQVVFIITPKRGLEKKISRLVGLASVTSTSLLASLTAGDI